MRNYYSIPLLFFCLAAGIGLFLRWQFIDPTPGTRYPWFVHSHSHVMFLGWILNVLFLSFTEYHLSEKDRPQFLKYFLLLQVPVFAMMISFPLQGYGMFSIIFSTVHTLATAVAVAIFFRKTAGRSETSLWFAKAAWIFFLVSTAGPFSLGYLMANGMGTTVWYNLSIYYYLHFQYNGLFLFGVLGLFYQLLERHQISFDDARARRFGFWTAVACIPAYVLSALFAQPGIAFNLIGAAAALLQFYALYLFAIELRILRHPIRMKFRPAVYSLCKVVLLFWVVKLILQFVSAHPYIAELAYALRPVVIGYLHLVLLGVITAFLLAWYMERGFVRKRYAKFALWILTAGFLGTEICLVCMPWWTQLTGGVISSAIAIFSFSFLLFFGGLIFFLAFIKAAPNSPARL